jgi:adenylate cyclase
MALFGAPISLGDDPLSAVLCALEMQSEGKRFSAQQEAKGLPALPMGIGINTGPVVAGNIGSSTKMEYTVIGDEVNIAARKQGIAQPGEVLISENTYRIIADAVNVTQLEPITFKGKNAMVEVYRVDGLRKNE